MHRLFPWYVVGDGANTRSGRQLVRRIVCRHASYLFLYALAIGLGLSLGVYLVELLPS
jgi:hypothetical protein